MVYDGKTLHLSRKGLCIPIIAVFLDYIFDFTQVSLISASEYPQIPTVKDQKYQSLENWTYLLSCAAFTQTCCKGYFYSTPTSHLVL